MIMLIVILISIMINLDSIKADNEKYENYDPNAIVSCGGGYIEDIPSTLPKTISIIYTVVQVLVPIILVVVGTIDLLKSVVASKEDEIKKGQKTLLKRCIGAILIFCVFVIVKFVISIGADSSSVKIIDCAECFINNNCEEVA